jgi:hypothetical protein
MEGSSSGRQFLRVLHGSSPAYRKSMKYLVKIKISVSQNLILPNVFPVPPNLGNFSIYLLSFSVLMPSENIIFFKMFLEAEYICPLLMLPLKYKSPSFFTAGSKSLRTELPFLLLPPKLPLFHTIVKHMAQNHVRS